MKFMVRKKTPGKYIMLLHIMTSFIIYYSNMTWFFSPIELTDTNFALLAYKAALFHSRDSPFRESVLLAVFWVPWVKLGHY